jgi:hypothetical protein
MYYIQGDFILRNKVKTTLFKNKITIWIIYSIYLIFCRALLILWRIFKLKKKRYKIDIAICGIFKNEACFLDEWITYHELIGVQKFYLYNNNSDDNYIDVLSKYIERGIVELIEWPYNQGQMSAYKDCYEKNRNNCHWLGFIDIDEFVCPIKHSTINDFFKEFSNYPGVAIYWKQFGSSGILNHNMEKLVIEQYEQAWDRYSVFTKMFCNMDYEIFDFDNMHIISSRVFGFKINPINQFKNIIKFDVHKVRSNNYVIQINHYWGKAYDIFVRNKIERTDAYYKDSKALSEIRKNLLFSHEAMCTIKDFTIQRYLLETKLKMNSLKC